MSHGIVARSGIRSFFLFTRLTMVLLLLACSTVTLRAQTTSATVVGTLTDASGARIAGGTVLLKDLATGIEHSATTDANGEYVVPDLKAAHYSAGNSSTWRITPPSPRLPPSINSGSGAQVSATLNSSREVQLGAKFMF